MRAAVYNRYWTTLGGGERYAGKLAAVLAASGCETDLIGHEDVPLDILNRTLGLTLPNIRVRVVEDCGERRLQHVSAEYDLFVTATYMSRLIPRAQHNVYICFFPPPPNRGSAAILRTLCRAADFGVPNRMRSVLRRAAARYMPSLSLAPGSLSFLDHYDAVIAISEFAARWTHAWWGRTPYILYPPVRLDDLAPQPVRRPWILSVGRFFSPGPGHSKQQLQLVALFRRLVDSGVLDGWEFHLAGRCDSAQENYLAHLRKASDGLPISIQVNTERSAISELVSAGSIFWSGAGLDKDESREPWAMEHFGITTVEAMAGGCVPIVIGKGGLCEIVRDGIEGFHCINGEQLLERTVQVARTPAKSAACSSRAISRAHRFSECRFEQDWHNIASEAGIPLPA